MGIRFNTIISRSSRNYKVHFSETMLRRICLQSPNINTLFFSNFIVIMTSSYVLLMSTCGTFSLPGIHWNDHENFDTIFFGLNM